MKIGMVTPLRPHPQRSGTRIRLFHFCRLLAQRHALYLADLETDPSCEAVDDVAPYCRDIAWFPARHGSMLRRLSDRLLFRPFTIDRTILAPLRQWMRKHELDAVIGAKSLAFYYMNAAGIPEGTLRVIDDGLTAHRHVNAASRVEPALHRRARLRLQSWKLARAEARLARSCDCIVTPSPHEGAYLGAQFGKERIVVAPNGVDTVFFGNRPWHGESSAEVLFFGTFRFEANVDAARYLVERILPRLPERYTACIAGEYPPDDLVRLAQGNSRIRTLGYVDDLRPVLERCLAVVIPLRIGTGTRLKILHAMAAGCPVVSTRLGAEGIDATDGKEIIIAESASAFAQAVTRLSSDPAFARSVGACGRRLVERAYDWTAIVAGFERELVRRTIRRGNGTPGGAP